MSQTKCHHRVIAYKLLIKTAILDGNVLIEDKMWMRFSETYGIRRQEPHSKHVNELELLNNSRGKMQFASKTQIS